MPKKNTKKARPERPPHNKDLKVFISSEEGREGHLVSSLSVLVVISNDAGNPCVTEKKRKQRREKDEDVDARDSKFETLFGKEKSEMRATSARVEKKRPDELVRRER